MTIGEKIKKRRIELKMSQEELGTKVGYNGRSAIAYIESGKREPHKDKIQLFAKALDVTPEWLMGWDKSYSTKVESYAIPVYGSVSAGFGASAIDEVIDSIQAFGINSSQLDEYIGIKVTGESMSPKIDDGSIIIVHQQPIANNNEIVIACIDEDDWVVKQFKFDGSKITLHSFNSEYKDREFRASEMQRLRIYGVVKQIINFL